MKLGVHAKIAIGWTVLVAAGLYSFYLVKVNIDKQRYQHMKTRERIRLANFGEYEPSSRKF